MSERMKTEDIATECGKSLRYVREVLVKRPGFPRPVVNTPRGKVWMAECTR